jgi:hypothetical protein
MKYGQDDDSFVFLKEEDTIRKPAHQAAPNFLVNERILSGVPLD